MDFSRLKRLLLRLMARGRTYNEFRKIISLDQLLVYSESCRHDFLNGNILRAKVFQALVEKGNCGLFVETGTSHAATSIGIHNLLALPVWTCEINKKDYLISRVVTFGISKITLFNLDSREFLNSSVAKLKRTNIIGIFYLDAHEGSDSNSLPLKEEIKTILELDTFVVMIDDFRVPSEEGFGYGTYGGIHVDINLIRDELLSANIKSCYFPDYMPSKDTGYPSGYCIFWRSTLLDKLIVKGDFPFNLLKKFSVQQSSYLSE